MHNAHICGNTDPIRGVIPLAFFMSIAWRACVLYVQCAYLYEYLVLKCTLEHTIFQDLPQVIHAHTCNVKLSEFHSNMHTVESS